MTINANTGVVTRNVEYYSIGHFSEFVRNGAHRIGSAISAQPVAVDHVAFLNTDGSRVIVFSNSGSVQQSVVVRDKTKQFTVPIPAGSVVTSVWK